jgi:acetyl-CoA carboxylase biotin carboxyl carrier protein
MDGGRLDSEIKELMEYIEASSFVEFELEREGFKIKLVKRAAVSNGAAGAPAPAMVAAQQVVEAPAARPAVVESPDLHLVKSPIVGTFYRAGAPGSRSFVEVGDKVKKGQILCIVEAMKLMNEIESDVAGQVVKVFPQNGQPVEYGERLFAIKTN